MKLLDKLALTDAKTRFNKIIANNPQDQHIAEEALKVAQFGAAEIYKAGFRAALELAALKTVGHNE